MREMSVFVQKACYADAELDLLRTLITSIDRLQQTLNAQRIGRSCEVVVLRHTRKLTLMATAIEWPQG